jgi:hypothetical protein
MGDNELGRIGKHRSRCGSIASRLISTKPASRPAKAGFVTPAERQFPP